MSKTILAYDCSGSTNCEDFYHETSASIVAKLPEDTHVLIWNDRTEIANLDRVRALNRRRFGCGGTSSSKLVPYLCEHDNYHFVLITDGQVSDTEIKRTDEFMRKHKGIRSADIHVIGDGANLSVSCPFTRNCPHRIFEYEQYTSPSVTVSLTEEDLKVYEMIDDLKTVEEIQDKLPSIERVVTAKMVGRTDPDQDLANAIIAMRRRLVQDLATKKATTSAATEFIEAVRQGNGAYSALTAFVDDYYKESLDIESQVNRLIQVVQNGLLKNTFDMSGIRAQLGANERRMDRAAEVDTQAVEELPVTDDAVSECPITMTDESDMLILITDGPVMFDSFQTREVDAFMNCPLSALKSKFFVDMLKGRIDQVISMSSYMQLENKTISPYSRNKILGVISLSRDPSHVKTTNWTLSRLLNGTAKRPGNLDLWYAVLTCTLESMDRFNDQISLVKDNLVWRMKHHTSFASLTGLSTYITTRLPLEICLWFVLHSYRRKSSVGTFLLHLHHMDFVEKLVWLAGLPTDLNDHYHLTKLRVNMQTWLKKDKPEFDRAILALKWAIAKDTHGVWMITPTKIVLVEDTPSPEQLAYVKDTMFPPLYKQYDEDVIVGVYEELETHRAHNLTTENYIQAVLDVYPTCKPRKMRWKPDDQEPWPVPICLKTCRPYYQVSTNQTWRDALEAKVGHNELESVISLNKSFEGFLIQHGRYPMSTEDFVWKIMGWYPRLPKNIVALCASVLKDYQEMMTTISVDECIRRMERSMPVWQRVILEKE
jgi:hypothetical protein